MPAVHVEVEAVTGREEEEGGGLKATISVSPLADYSSNVHGRVLLNWLDLEMCFCMIPIHRCNRTMYVRRKGV